MTNEPTIRLYAFSVSAMHSGPPPTAIGVQVAVAALPDGTSVEEAGLELARHIFPETDGWEQHFATAIEITQGFPLDPYHLVWRLEKGEAHVA